MMIRHTYRVTSEDPKASKTKKQRQVIKFHASYCMISGFQLVVLNLQLANALFGGKLPQEFAHRVQCAVRADQRKVT